MVRTILSLILLSGIILSCFDAKAQTKPTSSGNTFLIQESADKVFAEADFSFDDEDDDTFIKIKIISLSLNGGSLLLNALPVVGDEEIDVADLTLLTAQPSGTNSLSFTYTVFDDNDGESDVTATMTINVNAAPTALNNTFLILFGASKTFASADFNFNDSDNDDFDKIEIKSLNLGSGGTLTLSGTDVTVNQQIIVTELTNLVATPADITSLEFTFSVFDDRGGESTTQNITINVNRAPTATGNDFLVQEGAAKTFHDSDFGFADLDGDDLLQVQIKSITLAGGSLQNNSVDLAVNDLIPFADLGNIVATPSGLNTISFTYTVFDDRDAESATASISVEVNARPTAQDNSVVVSAGSSAGFTQSDFGFSDTDTDSFDKIKIGTLSLNGGTFQLNSVNVIADQEIDVVDLGLLVLQPSGANAASFTFQVLDDRGGISSPENTFTVTVNQLPSASNATILLQEGEFNTFAVVDFSFTDPDADALAFVKIITQDLNGGTLELNSLSVVDDQEIAASDLINLVATPSVTNTISFTFSVIDDRGAESSSDYTYTINVNAAPTSANNSFVVAQGDTKTFILADFNFNDADGDAFASIQILSQSGGGELLLDTDVVNNNDIINAADITTLSLSPNGAVTASFTFQVIDDRGGRSAIQTISVGVNQLPTASNNTVIVQEATEYTFQETDFNFSDPDDDAFDKIRIINTVASGSLTLSGTPLADNDEISVNNLANFTFTPTGTTDASFTFRVIDDRGAVSASVYTLSLDVNARPSAANNTFLLQINQSKSFDEADFTYSDPDSDAFDKVRIVSQTLNGGALTLNSITVQNNDEISEAELADLVLSPSGTNSASFTFRVIDIRGGVSAAANSITVNVNIPPTSANASVDALQEADYTFSAVNFPFTDDNNFDGIEVVSVPDKGRLKIGGTTVTANQIVANVTTLVFEPATGDDEFGSLYTDFSFKVRDDVGGISTDAYTMSINVNGKPRASSVTLLSAPTSAPSSPVEASYVYSDPEGNPENTGAVTYQWYISDFSDGTGFSPIASATNSSYQATVLQQGKYIAVGVRVRANTGSLIGLEVLSDFNLVLDGVSPTFISKTPLGTGGGDAVAVNTNIVFTFSEAVVLGSAGTITIHRSSDNAVVQTIQITDNVFSNLGTTVITVDPIFQLPSAANYLYINISAGFFVDLSGNQFQGYSGNGEIAYRFRTATDAIRPQILSLNPTSNSIDLPLSGFTFELAYDEPVNKQTPANLISIVDYDTDAVVKSVSVTNTTVTGNLVTFTFLETPALQENKRYYITIPFASFRGTANNNTNNDNAAVTNKAIWNFTTVQDGSGPVFNGLTSIPTAGAAGVSVSQLTLALTDASNIAKGTNGKLYVWVDSTTDFIIDSVDINSPSVVINNAVNPKTVTIPLSRALSGNQSYYVIISANAFQDVIGNQFAGISNQSTWTFSTTADAVAPTVLLFNPADNAVNIGLSPSLEITFSEPVIKQADKSIWIYKGATIVETISTNSAVVTGSGTNKISINPANDFIGLTDYHIRIESGAFRDASNNNFVGIANATTWNFRTIEDAVAPILVSTLPDNAATDVAISSKYTLAFDKPLSAVTGKFLTINPGGVQLAATGASMNGGTVEFTLPTLAYQTAYTVSLESGAFTDASGNETPLINRSFTTLADVFPPLVTTLSPLDKATSVGLNDNLILTFDQTIIKGTGVISIFNSNGELFEAINVSNAAISVVGNTATINPANTFAGLNNYYVLIPSGVFTDTNGTPNAFAGFNTNNGWTFTTQADATIPAPNFVTSSPANASTNIDLYNNFTLPFSETILKGGGSISLFTADNNLVSNLGVNSANISGWGSSILTIDWPINLIPNSTYYVLIDAGFVLDASGNPNGLINDVNAWRFSTRDALQIINNQVEYNICIAAAFEEVDIQLMEVQNNDFATGAQTLQLSVPVGFEFVELPTNLPALGDLSIITFNLLNSNRTLQLNYTVSGTSQLDQINLNLRIKSTLTTEEVATITRSGGTATIYGGRVDDARIYATINSKLRPNKPTVILAQSSYCVDEAFDSNFVNVSSAVASPIFRWYANADLSLISEINPTSTTNPNPVELGFSNATSADRTVYVTVTDASGCESEASAVNVPVYGIPTALPKDDFSTCSDELFTLGESPAASGGASGTTYSYTWYDNLNNVISTNQNPQLSVNNVSDFPLFIEYSLVVTDNISGCQSAPEYVMVTVNPLPELEILANSNYPYNAGLVDLVANPAGGQFSGPGVTFVSAGVYKFSPSFNGENSIITTIRYDYTDANGCDNFITKDINIYDPTSAFDNLDLSYCRNDDRVLLQPITIDFDLSDIINYYVEGGTTQMIEFDGGNYYFVPSQALTGFNNVSIDYQVGAEILTRRQAVQIFEVTEVAFIEVNSYCTSETNVPLRKNDILNPYTSGNLRDFSFSSIPFEPGLITGSADLGYVINPNVVQIASGYGPAYFDIIYTYTNANGCTTEGTYPVKIYKQPTLPEATNLVVCENTNLANVPAFDITNVEAGINFEYQWYANAALTDRIISTGNPRYVAINSTSTVGDFKFWVTRSYNGCESEALELTISVLPVPTAPNTSDVSFEVCQQEPVNDLGFAPGSGNVYRWYADSNKATLLQEGDFLSKEVHGLDENSAAGTYTFYVSQLVNGCESIVSPATITIKRKLQPATINGVVDYCQFDVLGTLTASPAAADVGVAGITYEWYNDANQLVSTQANYTPNASLSTNVGSYFYKVISYLEGCASEEQIVEISVKTKLSMPFAADAEYCANDFVVITPLEVAPDIIQPGVSFRWYANADRSTLLATGTSLATGLSTSNNPGIYNYYLTQTLDGCESDNYEVALKITERPSAPTVTNLFVCQGVDLDQISVTNPENGVSYTWYSDAGLTTLLGTGISIANHGITAESESDSYIFYVTKTENSCVSLASALVVRVEPTPEAPTANNRVFCQVDDFGTTPGFTAVKSSTAAILKWYSFEDPNQLLEEGNVFTQHGLDANTGSGEYKFLVTQTLRYNNNTLLCESKPDTLVIQINQKPSAPVIESLFVRCKDEPLGSIQAVAATGNEIRWYRNINLGASLIQSSNSAPREFNTEVGDTTIVLYVTTRTPLGCESDPVAVSLLVKDRPDAPIAPDSYVYCTGDEINPISIGIEAGTTVKWYLNSINEANIITTGVSADGSSLNTGFNGQTAVASRNYIVTQEREGCVSNPKTIQFVIQQTPNKPSFLTSSANRDNNTTQHFYCYDATAPIQVVNAVPGFSVDWYLVEGTDTSLVIQNSTSLETGLFRNAATGNQTLERHYLARQSRDGCFSDFELFMVTIFPETTKPIVTNADLQIGDRYVYCVEGSTLPIVQAVGTNLQWINSLNGVVVATGNQFEPVQTGTYLVRSIDNQCPSEPVEVAIERKPIADFSWSGVCFGSATAFTLDQTQLPGSNFTWVFERISDQDESLSLVGTSSQANPEFLFPQVGRYKVSITIESVNNCINAATEEVFILPSESESYLANFDTDNQGWIARASNGKWTLGTLPNNASSGNFWFLEDGVAYTSGNANEWEVLGPCFDLNGFTRPMISLDIAYKNSENVDGAAVLFSTDGGEVWSTLGRFENGLNWYNKRDIRSISIPNGQVWSGNSDGWVNSRYSLDEFKVGSAQTVRFKIVFATPTGASQMVNDFGFRFDNFEIKERSRTVLVESFVNIEDVTSAATKDRVELFANDNTRDVLVMNYHTNFTDGRIDPINAVNPTDPAVRSLFYGISQVNRLVLDGSTNRNVTTPWSTANLTVSSSAVIAEKEAAYAPVVSRSLVDPKFDLQISEIGTNNEFVSIQAQLTALEDINNQNLALFVVLVENEVNINGINYKNAVRKMLPSAAGKILNKTWTRSQTLTLQEGDLNWKVRGFADPSKISAIVFVQNTDTREIYQTVKIPIDTKVQNTITGTGDVVLKSSVIYPNPASTTFTIDMGETVMNEYKMTLYNNLGVEVYRGQITKGQRNATIEISHLRHGAYQLMISNPNGGYIIHKLMISK